MSALPSSAQSSEASMGGGGKTVTITGTLGVYLPSYYSVKELFEDVRKGNSENAFSHLSITDADMSSGKDPWPRIGTAKVSIQLTSQDEAVRASLAALQHELDAARTEWLQKQQAITERISKLQAIEYVEAA